AATSAAAIATAPRATTATAPSGPARRGRRAGPSPAPTAAPPTAPPPPTRRPPPTPPPTTRPPPTPGATRPPTPPPKDRAGDRGASGPYPLLPALVVVLAAVDLVDARKLSDFEARDLPRALHDPGERAVQPRRLVLDLLQHLFGEVEALLALVRARVG